MTRSPPTQSTIGASLPASAGPNLAPEPEVPIAPPATHLIAKLTVCVIAFVLLDWATFTPGLAPLGITPWNPAIGLAVAFVLAGGPSYSPLLVLAPFVSDMIVRDLPFPWPVTALEAFLTGLIYFAGLRYLSSVKSGFDRTLHSIRDLVRLGVVAAASAAGAAVAYNSVLALLGILPVERLLESILRYWIGDAIGITVMTPFLLLMAFRREFPQMSLESLLQGVAILAAVIVVFGITGKNQVQLSYVLLLPIVWIAVRFGFEGVTAGLLLMQVCIMVALHIGDIDTEHITNFQAVMVVLAVSGLAIGLLTSERRHAERRIRLQQDAIARAARLGSMGEFAAALAHELNQPLTAAGNYARATVGALQGATPRIEDARYSAEKLIEQVDRSAQVIRRLRDLIRMGRIEPKPHSVRKLLAESLDLLHPELARQPVAVDQSIAPDVPLVSIDLLQIEQVVTNLVRNAVEATLEAGVPNPRVTIAVRTASADVVEIAISDNGPGFPPDFSIDKSRATLSSKADGLGIGLSLCQSIVEAHGGALSLDNRTGGGATVRFTLPASKA